SFPSNTPGGCSKRPASAPPCWRSAAATTPVSSTRARGISTAWSNSLPRTLTEPPAGLAHQQNDIQRRAGGDAQQRLAQTPLQDHDNEDGERFEPGQPAAIVSMPPSGVDHQQHHDCQRQVVAQLVDHAMAPKPRAGGKRQRSQNKGDQRHADDGDRDIDDMTHAPPASAAGPGRSSTAATLMAMATVNAWSGASHKASA